MGNAIDSAQLTDPVFLPGNATTAYRDPAGYYHDGTFRVFHTLVRIEPDGRHFLHTAVTSSRDLSHWTPPRLLTPRDQDLNYSSPGNVIRHGNVWRLCLQTYPTPRNDTYGNETARLFTMQSHDLETWSPPELLPVKGPHVPVSEMGRMIDPYLVEDRRERGKWWCFYKQNGLSMSYTRDFVTWHWFGNIDAGENPCVLADRDGYAVFHSPENGIGIKRSPDLSVWQDGPLEFLGQRDWPWARGRLTAAHVLDLRGEPSVGKYIMFFHGSTVAGLRRRSLHGEASLGLAWSDDLQNWSWPGSTGGGSKH